MSSARSRIHSQRASYERPHPLLPRQSAGDHRLRAHHRPRRHRLALRDPGRHPAGLQEPRRAGAHLLRRHGGHQRRGRHHHPAWNARPARRPAPSARIPAPSSAPASSATTTPTPPTPTGRSPRSTPWPPPPSPTCRPVRCRRSCLPFDPTGTTPHRAGRPQQQDAGRIGPLRFGPLRDPQFHHGLQGGQRPGRLRRQAAHHPRQAQPPRAPGARPLPRSTS